MTAILGFRQEPAELSFVGSGLQRPECVLAGNDGSLIVSDLRGQAAHIGEDSDLIAIYGTREGRPNGITLLADGTLLVADIGKGRVLSVAPDGIQSVLFDGFEGGPLGACNFVLRDAEDRLWLSVSSRSMPVADAIRLRPRDGAVFRMHDNRLSVVLEGLDFANEIRISADGSKLFVAETFAGSVSCAEIRPDCSLEPARPYGPSPLFEGAFVDGLAFDADGNLWVTELSRNAILAITPDNRVHTILEDPSGHYLRQPTSIAFGGADLKTVYIGSLKMQSIATFRSPVAGLPLPHGSFSQILTSKHPRRNDQL